MFYSKIFEYMDSKKLKKRKKQLGKVHCDIFLQKNDTAVGEICKSDEKSIELCRKSGK